MNMKRARIYLGVAIMVGTTSITTTASAATSPHKAYCAAVSKLDATLLVNGDKSKAFDRYMNGPFSVAFSRAPKRDRTAGLKAVNAVSDTVGLANLSRYCKLRTPSAKGIEALAKET